MRRSTMMMAVGMIGTAFVATAAALGAGIVFVCLVTAFVLAADILVYLILRRT